MILIWDNGESYSMHCIHFVRFDPKTFSEAEIVSCLPKKERHADPHIVAIVEESALDWRSPNAYQEIGDLITPDWFLKRESRQDDKIDEEHWNPSMVGRLLPMWRERPIHYTYGTREYMHPQAWLDLLEARLKAEAQTKECMS